MSRHCDQAECTSHQQPTDALVCPTCAHATIEDGPVSEGAVVASYYHAPVLETVETEGSSLSYDVVFVASSDADSKVRKGARRQKYLPPLIVAIDFVASLGFALTNHYRILFALSALLALQTLIVLERARHYVGPVIRDDALESRVAPALKSLCERAGVASPKVKLQETLFGIGVLAKKQQRVLLVSPMLAAQLRDEELVAVLAHEVIHLRSNDVAVALAQRKLLSLGYSVAGLSLVFAIGHGSWFAVFLFWALVFPALRFGALGLGLINRWRELRADKEGAELCNDPTALAMALERVYANVADRRKEIFGTGLWKWLLFPLSLRPTSHPSVAKRRERLGITTAS